MPLRRLLSALAPFAGMLSPLCEGLIHAVIPAKAGIQGTSETSRDALDPRLRGDDGEQWQWLGIRRGAFLLLALAVAGCAMHQNPTEMRDWPITVAPAAENSRRLTAVPPDCDLAALPPLRDDVGAWHNPDLNLGCSTARNLGLMVARPRDLVVGRDPGPADGERGAAAMERYRKGNEKPLMRENAGTLAAAASTGGGPSQGGGASGGQ